MRFLAIVLLIAFGHPVAALLYLALCVFP